MDQSIFKKLLPHAIAVVIFLVVAAIASKTALQSGMMLNQSDMAGWKGMAQKSFEYKEQHGHFPLWITSMFGGMPAYTIAMDGPWHPSGILHTILTLGLPEPMNYFFLSCICFYFLGLCAGARPGVAIAGALGFAFCSYNPIIISAGHVTKMQALAYLPALLGGILLVYQKKYAWGFVLTALFTMLEINMNHQQISYYFFIVALIMTLFYIVRWVKQKEFIHLGKSVGLVAIAGVLGVLVNAVTLFTVYDFTKYSKRGGQLIMDEKAPAAEATKTSGLSVDYAFQWSYGKQETFTLLFPGIMGYGARGAELDEKSHIAGYLQEKLNQPEEQAVQMAASFAGTLYWGDQPFTEGPVYLGAVICFLFVFAMVYLKSHHKWWIITASLLAILMSWGNNFKEFNEFLFNYLPLYNKFRAPAMILIIPQLLFPLAAILALEQLMQDKKDALLSKKLIKNTGIALAVLFAVAGLIYISADYRNENRSRTEAFNQMIASKSPDMGAEYAKLNASYEPKKDNRIYEDLVSNTQGNTEVAQGILSALRQDRASVFGKDIIRSLVYILLAFGLIILYLRKTFNETILAAGLALLVFIDLYTVDKNYLNENNYVEKDIYESDTFPLTEADKAILNDKDPNFRVYNMASGRDPYQESVTSYYHNSIGGYSPAKLGIFDDLITYQLSANPNPEIFNMLNTRYFIQKNPQNGTPVAIPNAAAYGNVWLVKEVRFVKNAAEEMRSLADLDPRDTAVVDESFKELIPAGFQFDSTASIRQVKFDNEAISYESNAANTQVAIFSEIYYAGGWQAYVDGKPVEHFKANYVLRGLAIPAGKHTIEFRFEPASYRIGAAFTRYSSILILLILGGVIIYTFMDQRKKSITNPDKKVIND